MTSKLTRPKAPIINQSMWRALCYTNTASVGIDSSYVQKEVYSTLELSAAEPRGLRRSAHSRHFCTSRHFSLSAGSGRSGSVPPKLLPAKVNPSVPLPGHLRWSAPSRHFLPLPPASGARTRFPPKLIPPCASRIPRFECGGSDPWRQTPKLKLWFHSLRLRYFGHCITYRGKWQPVPFFLRVQRPLVG